MRLIVTVLTIVGRALCASCTTVLSMVGEHYAPHVPLFSAW